MQTSPSFRHVKCDRKETKQFAAKIREICLEYGPITTLIDFCAYDISDLKASLEGIPEGMLKQYIYISTDSVYQMLKLDGSIGNIKESATDILPRLS